MQMINKNHDYYYYIVISNNLFTVNKSVEFRVMNDTNYRN